MLSVPQSPPDHQPQPQSDCPLHLAAGTIHSKLPFMDTYRGVNIATGMVTELNLQPAVNEESKHSTEVHPIK